MTDEEVLTLASKCGAGWHDDAECELTRGQLLSFARSIEAAERERCAQWGRDNYQDHATIADLCEALVAKLTRKRAGKP